MSAEMQWILPDALFDAGRLRRDLALGLRGGRVAALEPAAALPADAPRIAIAGTLCPGLVDLQVNGGGGVLFNQSPSPEGLRRIAAAHRRLGTDAILPTVITDAPEVLATAAGAVRAAVAQGIPGIAGIHVEGPHISEARRGTHAARYIRPLDDGTLALVRGLRAEGLAVMITLAPEAARPEQIAELARCGAIVSLGHSDATAEQARAALAAGARCFTHLFNAMSPMQGRAPGMVGAAINSHAHAGIICDGVHVADEMLALAIRARPLPDRMFLVSDAMPTVGGPESFALYGRTIRLEGGRLINDEGSLAGAHVSLAESLQRLVGAVGIAPEAALRMALSVPAGLIGRDDLARIEGRAAEDLLILGADMALRGRLDAHLAAAAL